MPVAHSADRHALYRFYGETGQLLYAGISNDPGRRFGQHGATKSWWPTVRGITLEWHSSRRDALAAEARVIEVERPLFNVQRPNVADRSVPRSCGHCIGCLHGEPCQVLDDLAIYEDSAPIDRCPHCGSDECMYQYGFEVGEQFGWSRGYDHGRRSE